MMKPIPASSMAHSAPPGAKNLATPPEKAPDVVSLTRESSADEKDDQGRWVKTAAVVGLGLAGIGLLSGCTPGVPPVNETVTTNLPAAGISVDGNHTGSFGVEVLPTGTTRIDLHRETRTETDSDGDSHTENVDYNPVGVYMGNGVFLDLSGNLSLIPERAFEEIPRGPAASRVEIEPPGIWNQTTITRNGNTTLVDPAGPGSYTITHEGNQLKVDGPFWADWNFSQQGDTTRADFPLWGNFQVTRTENGARVTGPAFLGYDITRQGNQVNVNGPLWNDYTITRNGSTITVDPTGPGTIEISQHGTTTRQTGFGYGYNVTRDGNEVKTDGPGWDDWEFRVTR